MHTLIVGAAPVAGADDHYAHVIAEAGVLIAADAGLVLCRAAGRMPDVCVGDFDSTPVDVLQQAERAGARIVRFPAEKDESDLDLALGVARESGAPEVRFTAAFAGRLDHTLAAIGTVVAAADLGAVCEEPGWTGYALREAARATLELYERPGTVISLIALGGPARVTTDGLAYPLRESTIQPVSSLGLSNVATAGSQAINVLSGALLVIVNRSEGTEMLRSALDRTDTL